MKSEQRERWGGERFFFGCCYLNEKDIVVHCFLTVMLTVSGEDESSCPVT